MQLANSNSFVLLRTTEVGLEAATAAIGRSFNLCAATSNGSPVHSFSDASGNEVKLSFAHQEFDCGARLAAALASDSSLDFLIDLELVEGEGGVAWTSMSSNVAKNLNANHAENGLVFSRSMRLAWEGQTNSAKVVIDMSDVVESSSPLTTTALSIRVSKNSWDSRAIREVCDSLCSFSMHWEKALAELSNEVGVRSVGDVHGRSGRFFEDHDGEGRWVCGGGYSSAFRRAELFSDMVSSLGGPHGIAWRYGLPGDQSERLTEILKQATLADVTSLYRLESGPSRGILQASVNLPGVSCSAGFDI